MIGKKTIEAIASLLGVSASDLLAARDSEEEKDFDFDVFRVYRSEEDFEKDIDPIRKAKYDEGAEVGEKRGFKAIKERAGLEIESNKPDEIIRTLKSKVLEEADKNPDTRIKELESDLEKLRQTHASELSEKEKMINDLSTNIKTTSKTQKIRSIIPQKLNGVNQDDVLAILNSRFDFDQDETGSWIVKKDGQIIKGKDQRPISPETVVTDFLAERKYLVNSDGGSGGGDSSQKFADYKSIRKMSDLNKHLEEKGLNIKGTEAKAIIQEVIKSASDAKETFSYTE